MDTLPNSLSDFPPLPNHQPPPKPPDGGGGISFATALNGDYLCSNRTTKKTFSPSDSSPMSTTTSLNGIPALVFNKTDWNSMADSLRFALIGKFTSGCPPFKVLKSRFASFGLSGPYKLGFINFKHIVIRLSNAEDFARLWMRRVLYIEGFSLRLFKWSPDFDSKAESSIVPVWIGLPELPLHLFHKQALFEIASLIGKPLKVDEPTADQTRPSIARICVEVDLKAKRIEEIAILCDDIILNQRILYERVPEYCLTCCHLGHSDEACYNNGNPKPPLKQAKENTKRVDGKSAPTNKQYRPVEKQARKDNPSEGASTRFHLQEDPIVLELVQHNVNSTQEMRETTDCMTKDMHLLRKDIANNASFTQDLGINPNSNTLGKNITDAVALDDTNDPSNSRVQELNPPNENPNLEINSDLDPNPNFTLYVDLRPNSTSNPNLAGHTLQTTGNELICRENRFECLVESGDDYDNFNDDDISHHQNDHRSLANNSSQDVEQEMDVLLKQQALHNRSSSSDAVMDMAIQVETQSMEKVKKLRRKGSQQTSTTTRSRAPSGLNSNSHSQ